MNDEKKNFNLTNLILVVLLVVAAFLVGKMWNEISGLKQQMAQTATPTSIAQAQPTEQPTVLGEQQIGEITAGDTATKGNKDAKVTIVEFSDFQCPWCGKYATETFPKIEEEYITTGKVYYVFHSFPWASHQYAQKASEAADCAGEQGKFWEMHDLLFQNQDKLTLADLKKYATSLGFDSAKFNSCLDSGKFEEQVKSDYSLGESVGVQGTPAFFINGKLVSGAQPFEAFQTLIDAELNK